MSERKPFPRDYDSRPERFRTGSQSPWKYGEGDVHETVVERFLHEGLAPVLDMGCGEGRLCRLLAAHELPWVAMDLSMTMLGAFDGHRILADGSHIPAKDETFGGVAALYVLYHLTDPSTAIREAHRVTRTGGLFAAAAPSRHTDPELAALVGHTRSTFDAEEAPTLIGAVYSIVEVLTWDGPYVTLPHQAAVREYLFGRGVDPERAAAFAGNQSTPMTVTKRGCLVWGRKEGDG